MKKIFYICLILHLFFFSCVTSNQQVENIQSDESHVESENSSDENLQNTETKLLANDVQEVSDKLEENEKIDEEELLDNYYVIEEKILEEELEEDLLKLQDIQEEIFEEKIDKLDSLNQQPNTKISNEPKNQKESKVETTTDNEVALKPITEKKIVSIDVKSEKKSDLKVEQSKENNDSIITPSFDLQKEISENLENIQVSEEKTPSRSVQIKNNQFLEINYPGKGWIYLGEVERQNLLIFNNRKILGDNTTFTLKSKKSGTAILHFYKNDALSGKFIDDYLQVEIQNESATDNTPVVCKDYATVVPPAPEKKVAKDNNTDDLKIVQNLENPKTENFNTQIQHTQNPENEETQTIIKNASSEVLQPDNQETTSVQQTLEDTTQVLDLNLSADQLLQNAKNCYEQKKYQDALKFVEQFLLVTTEKIDEGLFLKAQILESKSAIRNIKDAIDNYNMIVEDFVQSQYWKKAKDRITYLKRFYIDIR